MVTLSTRLKGDVQARAARFPFQPPSSAVPCRAVPCRQIVGHVKLAPRWLLGPIGPQGGLANLFAQPDDVYVPTVKT
jgi:hypothetical protein